MDNLRRGLGQKKLRRLLGLRPAGSYGPQAALRPRFALPPGIPQGFRFAAPLALRAHPQIAPPKGGQMAPRSRNHRQSFEQAS